MFNAGMFETRRIRLRRLMKPNSVAIVPTSPVANYSHDTDYVFRAGSDFFYLTGFREPESVALISTVDGKPSFTLFVRPRDPERETWTGRRAGVDGARGTYLADEAYVIGEFKEKLPGYLENLDAVYIFPGRNHKFDRKLMKAWQEVRMKWRLGVDPPVEFIDLGHLLNEMRLFKTPDDLEILKQACRITCEAHELAMKAVGPGMNERELEALVNHYFRANGAFGPGFPTIVASGDNACILHYIENERQIRDGDLVLLDAGAEYEFFNGDVTRTYPSNGVFTPEQKAVYEVVLNAQSKAMELCTVGRIPEEMHDAAVKELVEGMIDLGILASRIFGVLLAMFVGVYLVYDEIERRTLYTLIAHGTRRRQFILGKYFGLLITISINIVIMCALLLLVLFLWGQKQESPIPWGTIVWQMSLVIMEMGVVIAFAILFSTFSTPVLSAFLTFFLWIIGNATLDILGHVITYQEHRHLTWLAEIFRGIYLPLPQLGVFNIIRYTLYAEPLKFTLFPYLYGVVYSAGILSIAMLIFSRKDIK